MDSGNIIENSIKEDQEEESFEGEIVILFSKL